METQPHGGRLRAEKGGYPVGEVIAPAWVNMPPGTFWLKTLGPESTWGSDVREQRPRVKSAGFPDPLDTMGTCELHSFNDSWGATDGACVLGFGTC